MLLITGTIRLPTARLADARPAMLAMIAASRAEAGCMAYAYAEDVADAGLIRIHELWADRDALAAHFQSAHIAVWRAQWPVLGITDRNLRLYEVGDGEAI